MTLDSFLKSGWCRFPRDPALEEWGRHALPAARRAVADPEHAQWLRYGGTWFAGVHALENDGTGAVTGGPPLSGMAVDFIREALTLRGFEWDRAQVSVCYPGYPRPMPSESEAVFGYRVRRDAAHVDGLRRDGPDRRRHLHEHHGFILGIPLAEAGPGASPFVVWEGSHEIMRAAFRTRLTGIAPGKWAHEDVTETYHAARREAFETCPRVIVHARPGEAYLAHRLVLHGMAPWDPGARAGPDGRMIAYFRPEIAGPEHWLNAP